MCAQGFAYVRAIWLDEVPLTCPMKVPAEHWLHWLRNRRGSSPTDATELQLDHENHRDVDSSPGAFPSAAARAWRQAQIGATALISRSAAPPVSGPVPPTGAKRR